MKKVIMQPFKAPRSTKEPSSPKVQARPTRQSPRRLGKSGNDVADSEGETELVCASWVINETQEADIVQSDNESLAKIDCEELNGSGERWSIEARINRSPEPHSSQGPLSTNTASPNITEFEAFLEQDVATQRPLPNGATSVQGKQKKLSKNDEFWEGVLASEKQRLQQLSEAALTSVDAMMLGSGSDEDNGDTPLRQAVHRRAKAILRSINEPHGGSSGALPLLLNCSNGRHLITSPYHL